ncbi:MAG: hypothetical protein U1F50_07935 [Rubrivivax sp.]
MTCTMRPSRSRAQAHAERILDRLPPGGFGAPAFLGRFHLVQAAPQERGGAAAQRQEERHHQRHRRAPPGHARLARGDFEEGVGQPRLQAHLVGLAALWRQRLAGAGQALAQAVDDAHLVLARQPPGHRLAQQRRRRDAHDDAPAVGGGPRDVGADAAFVEPRRRHRRRRPRRLLRHVRAHPVAGVEHGDADPQAAQAVDHRGLAQQRFGIVGRSQRGGERGHRLLLGRKRVGDAALHRQRIGQQRAVLVLHVGLQAPLQPHAERERERQRQQEGRRPGAAAARGGQGQGGRGHAGSLGRPRGARGAARARMWKSTTPGRRGAGGQSGPGDKA